MAWLGVDPTRGAREMYRNSEFQKKTDFGGVEHAWLLASTREGLANADTWKVLTKIKVSKSILQLAATNCVYIYIW